jgi:hypothetical protein
VRDLIAIFLGALVGGGFSFGAAFLYIGVVRRVGRKVFQSWLILLWFPVHVFFAVTLVAGFFFPFYALRLVGASFPLSNALNALAFFFGLAAAVPSLTYFFRQWHRLQLAGYVPPIKGLTSR